MKVSIIITYLDSVIGTVIYIANLSKHTRDRDLEDKFSEFGKLITCSVVKDPITRYHYLSNIMLNANSVSSSFSQDFNMQSTQ